MQRPEPDSAGTIVARGRAALAQGRWMAARAAFEGGLEDGESPELWEGLSWAAWWLDDAETVFRARERAFHLFQAGDDRRGAARMAIWLAADELDFHGALAVANGWLLRARRLLQGQQPSREYGWLAFHEGYLRGIEGRTDVLAERAREAAAIGSRVGVVDLELLGLALEGSMLVAGGEIEEGMSRLDEAAATALASEVEIPVSRAWACCFLVSACESVRDFRRAFEWCERIEEFAEQYGSRYMLGFCRAHYGAIHIWRGEWTAAEQALEEAADAYSRSRPALVPGVLASLAELRRRQGRWREADRLLGDATLGTAVLCRARLELDRQNPLRAAELAERWLRNLPPHRKTERAPALELLVRAYVAADEPAAAARALDALREVTRLVGTEPLLASLDLCEALVAAANGDVETARRRVEDAVDRFDRVPAPFEAAQARLTLASVLERMGRHDAAEQEATTASRILSDLGSSSQTVAAPTSFHPPLDVQPPLPALTPREREVVGWVASGLTNRQIAERLVLSEHTIHRHVTSILRKLDVPTRAAAAVEAVRSGIVPPAAP